MRKYLFLLVVIIGFPPTGKAQTGGQSVEFTEWAVPWENTRPRDPFPGPDGTVWFVGQRGHYVGRLHPATGQMDRIDLIDGEGPHTVIVHEDGSAWIAGNLARNIGRVDPETHEITRTIMDDDRLRDPHTMAFAPDGHLWFTAQGGNGVGRLDPSTGHVDVIPVETPRARPYGIELAPDGTPWIVAFGTNRLLSVDPETLELTEYVLPREETRPRRLGITSDGGIWYVDYAAGYLGRFDPSTGQTKEWASPGGNGSRPYAVAIDDRNRIWYFETGAAPNRLIGFDPATEAFIDGGSPESGGGTVRHMVFDPSERTIWFGTDTNTIGRA
jgi:virginiamycin B lyase